MFTGIITHLGKIVGIKKSVFTFIANPSFCKKISKGTSIAVNGICLTAFAKPALNSFSIEIMPETEKKTALRQLKKGSMVNLELPVTPQSLLSGHLVQGHIDDLAKLTSITKQGNSRLLKFSIPVNLSKYISEKGSIAVNGISLTVIKATKSYFTVGIIPFTWNNTMLNTIKIGDYVNIEVDILAKYLENLQKK